MSVIDEINSLTLAYQAEQAEEAAAMARCQTELAQTKAALQQAETDLATCRSNHAETKALLATTEAELAACQAAAGGDGEPVPPPTVTKMGVTVTGPVRKEYTDLHPSVKSSRVFWESMGQDWGSEPQHKAFPNSTWAVSCSEGASLATIRTRLDSIPAADLKKITAFCRTHEPENNAGMTPAKHRQMQEEAAPVIRAKGLRAASCLMGWTLDVDSGRNWRDWVSPDAVDVLAWDRYNSGAKKGVYQDPVKMLAPILAASQALGKPWQIWETGTNQFGDAAPRVEWTKKLRALVEKEGGEVCIWFDRPSTSGSDWNASMQPKAVAEAWLL